MRMDTCFTTGFLLTFPCLLTCYYIAFIVCFDVTEIVQTHPAKMTHIFPSSSRKRVICGLLADKTVLEMLKEFSLPTWKIFLQFKT